MSVAAGTPLAALLPVLTNTLVHTRHKTRVEDTLKQINASLLELGEKITELSESQYQIINEATLSILQTSDLNKIEYLKKAINNSISEEKIPSLYATQAMRVLRDISVQELEFLISNYQFEKIAFDTRESKLNILSVKHDTEEALAVSGLISLGIIIPAEQTYDNFGLYRFSPIASKVLALIG